MKTVSFFAVLGLLTFTNCVNNKKEAPQPVPVVECDPALSTYGIHVNPIIQTKCATSGGCHAAGSSFGDYTAFADLKAKVDNGSFKNSVLDHNSPEMPPVGSPQLTTEELKVLNCWYKNGAPNN